MVVHTLVRPIPACCTKLCVSSAFLNPSQAADCLLLAYPSAFFTHQVLSLLLSHWPSTSIPLSDWTREPLSCCCFLHCGPIGLQPPSPYLIGPGNLFTAAVAFTVIPLALILYLLSDWAREPLPCCCLLSQYPDSTLSVSSPSYSLDLALIIVLFFLA
jgi:hypothetical protein